MKKLVQSWQESSRYDAQWNVIIGAAPDGNKNIALLQIHRHKIGLTRTLMIANGRHHLRLLAHK
jgi:hypothetical protein